MTGHTTHNLITTDEQLDALYDAPVWAARMKECDQVIPAYRSFIEAAPYVMLATAGAEDVDCSSRGGDRGFVRVQDERTLLIPDYPGNNRIETLHNLVRDPRIALHFVIPGCGETLRVKGTAVISADPELTLSFAATAHGKTPKVVIVVTVTSAYFHCSRAIKRARLWDAASQRPREELPSVNAMLAGAQWLRCRTALTGN